MPATTPTSTPKLAVTLSDADVKAAIALWLNHHQVASAHWSPEQVRLDIQKRSVGHAMNEHDEPYLVATAEAHVELARG